MSIFHSWEMVENKKENIDCNLMQKPIISNRSLLYYYSPKFNIFISPGESLFINV